jgi:flagellar motility protein MotE (MotC chaperone)
MRKRVLTIIASILTPAFVRLRVLQVLIVCAVLLIFVRLERLYNISDSIFVHSAKAENKTDPKAAGTTPPQAAVPGTPPPSPAKDKPTADVPKSEFPTDQKPKEGFTTGSAGASFDILELSPEQVEVLRTLSKRHRDLVQRERSISEREATLQAIENRLEEKTSELKKIQEYLQQLLGEKDEKEKESIKKLVIVYEKMKPAEAANILQGLDLDTLLNIMDEMKDGKVSAILAKMEPLRARILTIELAQRRKKLEEKMKKDHDADAAAHPTLTPAAAPVAADPSKPAAVPDGAADAAKPDAKSPKPADKAKPDAADTAKAAPAGADKTDKSGGNGASAASDSSKSNAADAAKPAKAN